MWARLSFSTLARPSTWAEQEEGAPDRFADDEDDRQD